MVLAERARAPRRHSLALAVDMRRTDDERERIARAIERLLPRVERPTRYLGGEVNAWRKPAGEVVTRVALCFPDLYEVGMSHLGLRILYDQLNRLDGVAAERVFLPWTDLVELLRAERLPLTSLETRTPLDEFDIIGFSLQHELTLTNVLAMLELGGAPLWAAERSSGDPLVLGGGPLAFNPEPMAPFFDLILAGDGEEALPELIAARQQLVAAGATRSELVRELAQLEGWYAPALYDVEPEPRLGLWIPRPKVGERAPERVRRRVVFDLDRHPFPHEIVTPHTEIVHDRVSWEVMRGCPVGCRFCQAGFIQRPARERDPNGVLEGVQRSIAATGYDEFSLASLNTGCYGAIEPLLTRLMDELESQHVAVGLSSLHATTLTDTLVEQVKRVRKTGFTIAPEAGSQRLRDVINKNLTEEEILAAARRAFGAGWELIKLYFMIGLPTETDADVDALVELTGRIAQLGRELAGPRARVALSVSTFVPKAFTPFQWSGMASRARFAALQQRIRRQLPRGVQFRGHSQEASWLEGALSRADRRAAAVIAEAHRRGAAFDGWTERLQADVWRAAFAAAEIDADDWATRELPTDLALPWEVIDPWIRRSWLERERERALAGRSSPPCAADACSGCAPFADECTVGVVAGRRSARAPIGGRAGPQAPAAPAVSALPHRRRVRFEKLGRSRFLGHLDLVRALTMAFRRAGAPLAYTQGCQPRPRIALGPALGLGIASRAEYADVDLRAPLASDELLARVNRKLPEGLRLTHVVPIDSPCAALQDVIVRATYRAVIPGATTAELARRAQALLDAGRWEVVRQRKGGVRTLDIRPLIDRLEVTPDGAVAFTLVLAHEGAPRPSELLHAVAGESAAGAEIERLGLFALRGGRLVSPLLVGRRPRE